jgi:hypothetical protein
MHQTCLLSLQRGKSIARQCQDSTAGTIWITATANVSTRGFLMLPHSPVLEQGGSSEKAPVVDLSSSSDEGDLIVDVLRDEEFARRLFGDLYRDVLGPPDDGKIIILSDSDKEEEEHEEKAADTEVVPSSAVRSPASTASTDDVDGSSGGDEACLP